MKNIIILDKKIELQFNPKFYQINAIKESCKAFSEILKTRIEEKEQIKVTLYELDNEIDKKTIGLEFFNFCFGLMKNNSLI